MFSTSAAVAGGGVIAARRRSGRGGGRDGGRGGGGEEGYDSSIGSRHPFYCPNSFMMDAFVTERTFI